MRRTADAVGRSAERAAVWLLRLKGFTILATRYRGAAGEVDIVARRGPLVIFVEVKARRRSDVALAALGGRQRWRIRRAAEQFLRARPELAQSDIRFDLIALTPWRWPQHLPDAWRP